MGSACCSCCRKSGKRDPELPKNTQQKQANSVVIGAPKTRFVKCLLQGDATVGKTQIFDQFLSGKFEAEYRPTIGTDFVSKCMPMAQLGLAPHLGAAGSAAQGKVPTVLDLQLWDTAGQERFSMLSGTFLRGTHVVLFVYDVGSRASLEAIRWRWIPRFQSSCARDPRDVMAFLLGNKRDRPDEERQVGPEEARALAAKYNGWIRDVFELSAKSTEDVHICMRAVIGAYLRDAMEREKHVFGVDVVIGGALVTHNTDSANGVSVSVATEKTPLIRKKD